ncbi:MAG: ATP-dependent metallopeptidase FtsH/Yme1/Tma family protein, partial [Bacillota bacterium]
MNRVLRNLSIYLLIVLVIVALMKYAAPETTTVEQIRYDQFLELINRGEVASVSIQAEDGVNLITGETKTGSKFELTAPQNDQVLNTLLQEKNIPRRYIKPPQPAWWTGLLTSLLPILIFVFLFFFLMQQTQGGGNRVMSFGKSRARMITDDKRRVTFADVAGADEVKEELQEIVEFLKNPHKYNELGARIPKGVLLFGPP